MSSVQNSSFQEMSWLGAPSGQKYIRRTIWAYFLLFTNSVNYHCRNLCSYQLCDLDRAYDFTQCSSTSVFSMKVWQKSSHTEMCHLLIFLVAPWWKISQKISGIFAGIVNLGRPERSWITRNSAILMSEIGDSVGGMGDITQPGTWVRL